VTEPLIREELSRAGRGKPSPPPVFSLLGPEIARAAALPFTLKPWLVSAAFLFPALLLSGIIAGSVRGIEPEGKRRVLELIPALLNLAAAAGCVVVNARLATRRIERVEPPVRELAGWWASMPGVFLGLPIAFGVMWVALRGALESIAAAASQSPALGRYLEVLRVLPLSLAALLAASIAGLAISVTWLAAIRSVEECGAGRSGALFRDIWQRARTRLLFHAAVAAAAAGAAYVAMTWIADFIFGWGGGPSSPGSVAFLLYDHALRKTLIWTPPLAILGAFGVGSYLLLRNLDTES